jgi:hypothetical protein
MPGVPPLKGATYSFDISLTSQADLDIFQAAPTLAAADITVALDGAGANNITNLPASPADGVIHVTLTAAEMNADRIAVLFHDVAGNEWQDALVTIDTDTAQMNDLAQPGDPMNTTQWGGVAVGGMPNSTTPPTVGQVADAVYDEMLAGHVLPGSGAEAWANSGGAVVGSKEFVYTVTDFDTGLPIEGAEVIVYTDAARTNAIRVRYSDAFGKALFWLVPGTYYLRLNRAGYREALDVEVVVP